MDQCIQPKVDLLNGLRAVIIRAMAELKVFPMTELCLLAEKYGSDKCPQTNHHPYTPFYLEFFKDRREQVQGESLKSLIEKNGSDIDLFVDDGSHLVEHQVFTSKTLMPL